MSQQSNRYYCATLHPWAWRHLGTIQKQDIPHLRPPRHFVYSYFIEGSDQRLVVVFGRLHKDAKSRKRIFLSKRRSQRFRILIAVYTHYYRKSPPENSILSSLALDIMETVLPYLVDHSKDLFGQTYCYGTLLTSSKLLIDIE